MKKIWISPVVVLILLTATGCQPQKKNNANNAQPVAQNCDSYVTIIRAGRDAVRQKDYDQALGYFRSAQLVKTKDKKAAALIKQASFLSTASKEISARHFSAATAALNNTKKVADGDSSLNSSADELLTTTNKIKTSYDSYANQLQRAQLAYDQKDYSGAQSILKVLIGQNGIHDHSYTDIYIKALNLYVASLKSQQENNDNARNSSSISHGSNIIFSHSTDNKGY